MADRRIRRTPEAVREAAIATARLLLLEEGPGAITLKAVAGRLGMTHANLLHHFGSAETLQAALVAEMARDVTQQVEEAVHRVRAGQATFRDIVDVVFDAFDRNGGGRLVAWLVLSGKPANLEPLFRATRELLVAVEATAPSTLTDPLKQITEMTLAVVLPALGNSLLGKAMAEVLGVPTDEARRIVAEDMMLRAGLCQNEL